MLVTGSMQYCNVRVTFEEVLKGVFIRSLFALGSDALDIFRKRIHPSIKQTRRCRSKMSATGGADQQTPGDPPVRIKRSVNDFIFGKQIGEGSFSIVYLAKDIHTSKEWAVKVCDKRHIIRERKQEYIRREREALNRLSGVPGFLKLFCTFQDPVKLYFVTTYAKNGTLLQLMEKEKKFDMASVRFYAAQILLAIEEMHARHIIHRDLKPENVLLDEGFHVMIADFGSSRIDEKKQDIPSLGKYSGGESDSDDEPRRQPLRKRGSFVGTAQYVSPEILRGKTSTESSDLWSFGCILYQLVAGYPPFEGPNDYLIFQKILNLELGFPGDFDRNAEELIRKILVLEPRERLGIKDDCPYVSIRKHAFLDGVDFATIRTTRAPVSNSDAPVDVDHFPECAEPGLSDDQIVRMLHRDWFKVGSSSSNSPSPGP